MSDGTANGSIEDQVLQDIEDKGREVRNHYLFEVSTEAANRGMVDASPTRILNG